jgi:diguanylate cyclase (GGDEF)-like protein/PAS domain S-box-containing protein
MARGAAGALLEADLRLMAERIMTLTGATTAAFGLIEGDELAFRAGIGTLGTLHDRVPLDTGLCGVALRTGLPALSDDIETDPRSNVANGRRADIRSFLAVPVFAGGSALGLLIVASSEIAAFDERDVATLELVGSVLPAALGQAAANDAESERLARIVETQRDISAAGLDLDHVMNLIVERAMALTRAEGVMVSLVEGDDLVTRAAHGIAAGTLDSRRSIASSVASHAFTARGTLLIEDAETDPRINKAFQAACGDRSLICVPLFHGDRPVAAVNVMSRSLSERLDEDDRRTLELLAGGLSSAISGAAEFQAKREQLDALARFEAIYANALTGIMLASLDGALIGANPAFRRLLGLGSGPLDGQLISELVHLDDRATADAHFVPVLRGEIESALLEHRFVSVAGEVVWVDVSMSLVRDADGNPSFGVGVLQDVTQRNAAEDALRRQSELNEHQACHDALTGLPNRTLFRDRIGQALRLAQRGGGIAAVLMLDLDRFKAVNDSLGHAAGDALLVELSRRLAGALRGSDTVARLGGDEFGVLLSNPGTLSNVLVAVERVREALKAPAVVEGLPLSIDASIGIALFPRDGDEVETLLQRADVAMYDAKQESAGIAFYEGTRHTDDPVRLTLVGELRGALENRELVLHYQPKALLADGEVRSVEALLRWNHPALGLVGPDEFIPIAQQTGLIEPLTLYVVDEALRQCREWLDADLRLAIAVNLSTRNLLDPELPIQVAKLLAAWDVEPGLLEFEITESSVLADPARAGQVLERLSAMGIRISIDDFGTGYSSLSRLLRLPVDEIKIDRSFVSAMDDDPDAATIVRSTIELGRGLGLDVVAEGVETARTWSWLAALGCTYAQGYHLSRPLPPDDLRAWIVAHRGREATETWATA